MADKQRNVVLNFKMDGQVQYAQTLKQINMIMNNAAKEYKNHIAAMGKDASMTDKLTAEKKKLEIQMEAAAKRTKMLSDEFEAMSKDTNTTTEQLNRMYGKLLDAQRAERSLADSLNRVNEGLSEQAIESRKAMSDLDKLKNESKQLEAEQKALTSSFKLQKAELGENASEAEKLELAQKQLRQQTQLTDQVVKNLEKQLEQAKKAYGENSVEVKQLEAKLNDAKTTLKQFENSMDNAARGANDLEGELEELNQGMDLNNMLEATEIMAGLSEQLIAMGQAAMDTAIEFGDSQHKMQKSLGVTGEEAERLNKIAQEVWKNGFGEDLFEATDAVAQLYNTMGDVPDAELQSLTQSVLGISKVFGVDVSESITAVNSLMTNFGLTGKESLDYITFGLQHTSGVFRTDFMDALTELIPTFNGMGASAEQAFEMMLVAQQSGMENFDALSSLTQGFTDNIVGGGDDIAETFASIGGEAETTFKKFQEGGATAYDVFVATARQLGEVDEQTKMNQLGAELFGDVWTEAGADAVLSLGYVDGAIGDVNGKADEMAEKSPGDEWTSSLRELQSELVPIGTSIVEAMTPVVKVFGDMLEAFNKLPEPVQIFTKVLTGLSVAFIILAPIVGALAIAFMTLDIAILPIIATIVGLAAAITGIILVIKNWGDIVDWLTEKWNQFKDWFSELWSSIVQTCQDAWSSTVEFFSDAWSSFVEMCHSFFDPIAQFFSDLWSGIKDFFTETWNSIVETATNIWGQLKQAWEETWNTIVAFLDPIISFLQTMLEGAWLAIQAAAQIAWALICKYIVDPITQAYEWVKEKISDLANWLSEKWNTICFYTAEAWNLVKQYIIQPVTEAWNWVKEKFGELASWISEKWEWIKSITLSAWNLVKQYIIDPITQAYNWCKEKIGDLVNWVLGKWDIIQSATMTAFNTVKKYIIDPIKDARDKVKGIVDEIVGFFSNMKLKIPKIELPPMPHFSLETSTKEIMGKSITYPSGIDVEWRAKGGIFVQPTIFGMSNGKLQGAGEAGPEAVLPLNEKTLGDIGKGIAASMPQTSDNRPIVLQIDGKTFAQITGDYTDAEGGVRIRRIERGLA